MKETIPYYNPNLKVSQLLKAMFIEGAQDKCERFYRSYSGKKYVLLTNNCRSALSLVYSVLFSDCAVLVSPLICKVALQPIVESGNRIAFADIDNKTWNIDVKKLPQELPEFIKAIQITHFGGIPGELDEIINYAHEHNLLVIEDCAQGFGSHYHDMRLGSLGDVICFSGIKTAYGISGGVIATNDKDLYDKARKVLEVNKKENIFLGVYRTLRNCIDSYRSTSRLARQLYLMILHGRPNDKNRKREMIKVLRPSSISLRIWAFQLLNISKQHLLRKKVAQQLIKNLDCLEWQCNYFGEGTITPTKLYLCNPHIVSASFIKQLNEKGIQAMHLQQKYESYYQDSKNDNLWKNAMMVSEDLENFEKIHDTIVSVPLYENMTDDNMNLMLSNLQSILSQVIEKKAI